MLLRVLAGLAHASAGTVRLAGVTRADDSPAGWARRVGYVGPEAGIYPWMTPREVLDLAGRIAEYEPAERQHRIDMHGRALSVRRRSSTSRCSAAGVALAERVALAAAMLTDPEVLLLNEPLRSVDPEERSRLLAVPGRRRTVLITSRFPASEAGLVNQVAFLRDGRLLVHAPVRGARRARPDPLPAGHRGARRGDHRRRAAGRRAEPMNRLRTLSWMALHEMWISFRLIAVLGLPLLGGLLAIVVPPDLAGVTAVGGAGFWYAVGAGVAIAIAAGLAAGTMAHERRRGTVAWMAVRAVPRSAILLSWFVAFGLLLAAGIVLGSIGAWLAALGRAEATPDAIPFALGGRRDGRRGAGGRGGRAAGRHVPAADPRHGAGGRGRARSLLAAAIVHGAGRPAEPDRRDRAAGPPGRGEPAGRRCAAIGRRRAGRDRDPARPGRHGPRAQRPVTAAGLGRSPASAWGILVVASLGVFLGGAELMVVAIALPSIVADFGGWGDLAHASWIVNAYLLAYVVAMPLAGRAADLWGARRLYLVALVLFCLGSLGAGLSRIAGPQAGLDWLIAARVVQGFGGGALVPLSMALASHLFAGRSRATALGDRGRGHLRRDGGRAGLRGLGAAERVAADPRARPERLAVDLLPQRAGRDHHPAAALRGGGRRRDAARPRRDRPGRRAARGADPGGRGRGALAGRAARLGRRLDPARAGRGRRCSARASSSASCGRRRRSSTRASSPTRASPRPTG